MKNKKVLGILIGIVIIVALVLFFINSKFNSKNRIPEFVKNLDLFPGDGVFHCVYDGDKEAYTVGFLGDSDFGGPKDYYSSEGRKIFSYNWIDYPGLSLNGIETNCIYTIYNEDGTVTQDLCANLKLEVKCDEEPIYKGE